MASRCPKCILWFLLGIKINGEAEDHHFWIIFSPSRQLKLIRKKQIFSLRGQLLRGIFWLFGIFCLHLFNVEEATAPSLSIFTNAMYQVHSIWIQILKRSSKFYGLVCCCTFCGFHRFLLCDQSMPFLIILPEK